MGDSKVEKEVKENAKGRRQVNQEKKKETQVRKKRKDKKRKFSLDAENGRKMTERMERSNERNVAKKK